MRIARLLGDKSVEVKFMFPYTDLSVRKYCDAARVFSFRGRRSISEHLPDKVKALQFESTLTWSLLHLTD